MAYVLVVVVAILNILSLTFFKTGLQAAGGISIDDLVHPVRIVIKVMTTPFLLIGIMTSVCTTACWLATLTRLQASIALPLMNGIFYALLLVVSTTILGEQLSVPKVTALILILVGVLVLAHS